MTHLQKVIEAALDQPAPTKELRDALNDYLRQRHETLALPAVRKDRMAA